MDMQVHHAREDEPVPVIHKGQSPVFPGQLRVNAGALPLPADKIAVLRNDQLCCCLAVADVSFYHKLLHFLSPR